MAELHSLGFSCLDAFAGLATVPVYQNGDLAQCVYNLIDQGSDRE